MQFTDDQIVIKPRHCARLWQSCDYFVNGIELFHERTYFPYSVFKEITTSQWLPVGGTLVEISALAAKYGGEAAEAHYAPEGSDSYFLSFSDTDKALAFCRTNDFDSFLTLDKIKE